MITILSIDIGLKNFAQYVETVNESDLEKFRQSYLEIPVSKRFASDDRVQDVVRNICLTGKCSHISVHDIMFETCNDITTSTMFTIDTRRAIIEHLESQRQLFENVDIVVIEQQFFKTYSFGKKGKPIGVKGGGEANVKAIKIAEDVVMWFLMRYPFKEIVMFPSTDKTAMLGAPKGLTKPQRKKWSTEYCTQLFEKRGDDYILDTFKRKKKLQKQKLDDMCDAMLQCQAFKFKFLVAY
jgi:hypothetical protein